MKKITGLTAVPALTEKLALTKALASVGATVYKWQIPVEEQWLRKLRKDSTATFYPKGELLVSEDNATPVRPRLAFKFTINAAKPASAQYVYVDALSGEIFRKISVLQLCVAPGATAPQRGVLTQTATSKKIVAVLRQQDTPAPAALRYTTNLYPRRITTQYVGFWRLGENGRSPAGNCGGRPLNGIDTYNMQRQGNTSAAVNFTDNDNNWTAAEFHNASFDDAALDAHWGAEMTTDYFSVVHCRTSYDGSGSSSIRGYVHTELPSYDISFPDNDNAAWNPLTQLMVYGDGATLFKPFTSLDFVAHEIGHGFAQFMVGNDRVGFSRNRVDVEAQALNEGLSDIWGACVEHFAAPEKQNWKMGEDISNTASCERNLASPNSGTRLHYPDVYNGQYYDSFSYEPHINSTILSHWFYLVAQGGSGPNSAGTNYSVAGIGIDKAAKIVFKAEGFYLVPTATYANARQAMIDAAKELYGSCSAEVVAVTNAWFAVGLGSAIPAAPAITGPDFACTSPATFGLALDNVTWSTAPAGAFSPATGTGRQFSTSAIAGKTGTGTLTATVTSGTCAGTQFVKTVQLNATPAITGHYECTGGCSASSPLPSSGSLAQYSISVPAGEFNVYLDVLAGTAGFNPWQLSSRSTPGVYWYNTSGSVNSTAHLVLNPGQSAEFTVTAKAGSGGCSTPQITFIFTADAYPYPAFSATPNPAGDELTVSSIDETPPTGGTARPTPPPFDAELYDAYGKKVKTQKSDRGRASMDVRDLPNGLYNLRVGKDKDAYSKHIQIAH